MVWGGIDSLGHMAPFTYYVLTTTDQPDICIQRTNKYSTTLPQPSTAFPPKLPLILLSSEIFRVRVIYLHLLHLENPPPWFVNPPPPSSWHWPVLTCTKCLLAFFLSQNCAFGIISSTWISRKQQFSRHGDPQFINQRSFNFEELPNCRWCLPSHRPWKLAHTWSMGCFFCFHPACKRLSTRFGEQRKCLESPK